MLIKGADCDFLPISVKVFSACPHPTRHRQQGTQWSLLRASRRSHHFPSTQTRSPMTALYWEVKGWGISIRTISLFPASPFFIHNFILCGNHPISFDGLITGSGSGTDIPGEASKRAELGGGLHPCGFPQSGPWAHSLSCIPHRRPFSNPQSLPQHL